MAAADLSRALINEAFVSRREAVGEDDEVTFVRRKEVPTEPEGPITPADLARVDMAKRSLRVLGHCEDVPRPCPFVSCRHNLYLDVDTRSGEVRLNFPLIEPGDMPAESSCAMDVVARIGEQSAAAVAEMIGEGEVQVEIIERRNAPLLAEALREYSGHVGSPEESATPLGALSSAMQGGVEKGLAEDEEDRSGRVLPDRFYIHQYPVHHAETKRVGHPVEANLEDDEYERAAFKVYERSSRWHVAELELAEKLLRDSTPTVLVEAVLAKGGLTEERAARTVARAKERIVEANAARARHGKRGHIRARRDA